MARHYKSQPKLPEPKAKPAVPPIDDGGKVGRKVERFRVGGNHLLTYQCACGRAGKIWVHGSKPTGLLHDCPACGRTVTLTPAPASPP